MSEDDPILITGAARSGTSMVGGVVDMCGVFGGAMSGATQYNEKGMFENIEIRNNMVKPLLVEVKADPMAQKPLPKESDFDGVSGIVWRSDILNILKKEGYIEAEGTWFYKGAKMCLMWKLWHRAFPKARWIIVRRRTEDIINSCIRTGFMRAYTGREGWRGWVDVHIQRFEQMKEAGLNVREVYPQEMIDGNFSEMKSIIDWLGLEWKDLKAKDFVTPSLWHAKKEVK